MICLAEGNLTDGSLVTYEKEHLPIMTEEILSAVSDQVIDLVVDGTVGAGGHAQALLASHPEIHTYIAIDQDPSALAIAGQRLSPWASKIEWHHDNFESIKNIVLRRRPNFMLFDLGLSSMQIDRAERGFSFSHDGPLDMRMNPETGESAKEIVNQWSLEALGALLREGEERRWKKVAQAIVEARSKKPIETTLELVEVAKRAVGSPSFHNKQPCAILFQTLRRAVNREDETLQKGLYDAIELLAPAGTMAVLSFHSLEDRVVKNLFKAPQLHLKPLHKKPLIASPVELKKNPRARSAKLRIARKSIME